MRRSSTFLILALTGATCIAQLVRDLTLWLGLLMYVPLAVPATPAMVWDLSLRGRALRKRYLLFAIGLAVAALYVALMWSPARSPEGRPSQQSIDLLQWNAHWGGENGRPCIPEIVELLDARRPDIVALSEAPSPDAFDPLWRARHSDWSSVSVEHEPSAKYWYRLTVMSSYPVALLQEWTLRTGHAALFEVALEPHAVRILMVDLQSKARLPRSPSIAQAAQIVADYAAAGTPIDFVLGDFNTPGRFLGFDAVASAGEGYRESVLWSGQWRATWPVGLPLSPFDIDHIWVRRGIDIVSSELFSSSASDHRGQSTTLRLR